MRLMDQCHDNCRTCDLGLFPHDSVREGQEEFLEDARMCLGQRTHLLAHAPTGLGKTAVALTAALEAVSPYGGRALFLTPRQSQHAIAVSTLKAMSVKADVRAVDLIGRDDMCLAKRSGPAPCSLGRECYFDQDPGGTPDRLLERPLHAQEAMALCLKDGVCPHRAALEAVKHASVVVADYNQMFSRTADILERSQLDPSSTILVIDEAHNLPARAMDNHSAALTLDGIDAAIASPKLRHFGEDLGLLRSLVAKAVSSRSGLLASDYVDRPLKRECGVDASGLAEEMEEASKGDSSAWPVIGALRVWGLHPESAVRFAESGPERIVIRCIDPLPVVSPVLSKVACALLMSGTLHPPEMYADLLGAEGAVCRRYSSPYPTENREVLAVGGVSSRFRQRSPAMYKALASRISEICRSAPGNVAAFFPSYDLMERTREEVAPMPLGRTVICDRRDFGKNERDAVLHRMESGRCLLMSSMNGSFSEGVDFCSGLLSAVAIVGLPVPPPSRDRDLAMRRMEGRLGKRKAEHYMTTYPAVAKALQAAGRAIRGPEDRAAIVLLDDRYLMPGLRAAFPDDFRISRCDDLTASLDAFFARRREG